MIMPKFTGARPPYRTLSWPLGQQAMPWRSFSFRHTKSALFIFKMPESGLFVMQLPKRYFEISTQHSTYILDHLWCRLSIGVREHSIHGRSFIVRRITASLWRCVRASRKLWGTYFLNMDDNIIHGLALHLLRRLTISHFNMQFTYFHLVSWIML
jgi:hypothetical protein